jgi:hypothetical protein
MREEIHNSLGHGRDVLAQTLPSGRFPAFGILGMNQTDEEEE